MLNADSLAWYKDEQEMEQKYLLKLSGCKMKEVKKGTWTGKTRHVFEVYNPELRYVHVPSHHPFSEDTFSTKPLMFLWLHVASGSCSRRTGL